MFKGYACLNNPRGAQDSRLVPGPPNQLTPQRQSLGADAHRYTDGRSA
jgi:hypothetical protein